MAESFAELLEGTICDRQIKQGEILSAKVVDINPDVVIVSAGLKSEAVIPAEQFFNSEGLIEVQIGDQVDVAERDDWREAERWFCQVIAASLKFVYQGVE